MNKTYFSNAKDDLKKFFYKIKIGFLVVLLVLVGLLTTIGGVTVAKYVSNKGYILANEEKKGVEFKTFQLSYKERGYIISYVKNSYTKETDSIEYKEGKFITIDEVMQLTLFYKDSNNNISELSKILKSFSNTDTTISKLLENKKYRKDFSLDILNDERTLKNVLDLIQL